MLKEKAKHEEGDVDRTLRVPNGEPSQAQKDLHRHRERDNVAENVLQSSVISEEGKRKKSASNATTQYEARCAHW